jgi:hypothetical protein
LGEAIEEGGVQRVSGVTARRRNHLSVQGDRVELEGTVVFYQQGEVEI